MSQPGEFGNLAPASEAGGRFRLLRRLFVVQTILVIACLAGLIFISLRYSSNQKNYAQNLASEKAKLDEETQELAVTQGNLSREQFSRGQTAMRSKDFDLAISEFTDSLDFLPGNEITIRELTKAYLGAKRTGDALKYLQPIVNQFPTAPNFASLTIVQCAAKNFVAAKDDLVRAEKLDPNVLQKDKNLTAVCPASLLRQ